LQIREQNPEIDPEAGGRDLWGVLKNPMVGRTFLSADSHTH
jgi:hypothetical protein